MNLTERPIRPAFEVTVSYNWPARVYPRNHLAAYITLTVEPAYMMRDADVEIRDAFITPISITEVQGIDSNPDYSSLEMKPLAPLPCTVVGPNHGVSNPEGWTHIIVSQKAFDAGLLPGLEPTVADDTKALHTYKFELTARLSGRGWGYDLRIRLEEAICPSVWVDGAGVPTRLPSGRVSASQASKGTAGIDTVAQADSEQQAEHAEVADKTGVGQALGAEPSSTLSGEQQTRNKAALDTLALLANYRRSTA